MKEPKISSTNLEPPAQSTKKRYEAPRLTEFGSVRHTTRGSSGNKGDGMGSKRSAGMGMGMGMGFF